MLCVLASTNNKCYETSHEMKGHAVVLFAINTEIDPGLVGFGVVLAASRAPSSEVKSDEARLKAAANLSLVQYNEKILRRVIPPIQHVRLYVDSKQAVLHVVNFQVDLKSPHFQCSWSFTLHLRKIR